MINIPRFNWTKHLPPSRFLFRMTHYRNLQTYLSSGYLFAKNSPHLQAGYRISYDEIVARRGTRDFTTPSGSNVNDFVPFYFSPSTSMAFTIHKGNVPLKAPDGARLGMASMNDVAYLVVQPATLSVSGREFWFTNIACNSGVPATYNNDISEMQSHVDWMLFDETPKMGRIEEIGYDGVCRYSFDRDEPDRYRMRSKKRMAEFMVKDYLQMNEVSCIVLKNNTHLDDVQAWVNASGLHIPVYVKPGCYF